VKVPPQKSILGVDTNLHGIRLDAYLEVTETETDVELESDIYDIEPNKVIEKNSLPKRTRYYHSLIDSKLLGSGADYKSLKNVIIIMILPYDPFDRNRMVYTIQNKCIEDSDLPYDDGTKKIFLYTKGTEGNPSQELQEMLKYIENSIVTNVTNQNIAAIHQYVSNVKHDREVGVQYMKSWEYEQMIRDESLAEGLAEGQKQINILNQKLANAGRMDDIIKAASDREYQKQLLAEFERK
jgi:predicted transposase/invertase (TIGR01784 family)